MSKQTAVEWLSYIKNKWSHSDAIKEDYIIEDSKHVLILSISTVGMTCNEKIIKKIQKSFFWLKYWYQTKRGGHYTFKIDFSSEGYMLVSEYCKVNNCYNQLIYKSPHFYDWIHISKNKKLIRKKEPKK